MYPVCCQRYRNILLLLLFQIITQSATVEANNIQQDGIEDLNEKLISVTAEGKIGEMKRLMALGASVNCAFPSTGETPLHVAAIKCKTEVITLLLESGAKVNVHTKGGTQMSMTPLHWYVMMNPCSEKAVKLLLEAGADVSAVNSDGMTALEMVRPVVDRQHIVQLIENHMSKYDL